MATEPHPPAHPPTPGSTTAAASAHGPHSPVTAHRRPTTLTQTTRRGFATAGFALGMWGLLVFWWYPFGMAIASAGVAFSSVAVGLGIRGGKDGEHLAWYGLFLGATGAGLAFTVYRFMQVAFEGGPSTDLLKYVY